MVTTFGQPTAIAKTYSIYITTKLCGKITTFNVFWYSIPTNLDNILPLYFSTEVRYNIKHLNFFWNTTNIYIFTHHPQ